MLNMTFPKLKSIGLAGNPLHCSCELTRLKDLLNSTEQIFDEPVCKTPTYLEGVSIFEVTYTLNGVEAVKKMNIFLRLIYAIPKRHQYRQSYQLSLGWQFYWA